MSNKQLLSKYLAGEFTKEELRTAMYENATLSQRVKMLHPHEKPSELYDCLSSIDGALKLTSEEINERPEGHKDIIVDVVRD